jgi:glutamine synthetase
MFTYNGTHKEENSLSETLRRNPNMEMKDLLDEYGCMTFSDDVMKERIPKSTYKAFHEALDNGEALPKEVATVIANAMKIWAIEHGATHFTH